MASEGARFRAKRKELRMSQSDAAKAAGVGLRTVQNFESGEAHPQPANRAAMWAALGVTLEHVDRDGELGAEPAAPVPQEWPADVALFLDVLGVYLSRFPDPERTAAIREMTRQIFNNK